MRGREALELVLLEAYSGVLQGWGRALDALACSQQLPRALLRLWLHLLVVRESVSLPRPRHTGSKKRKKNVGLLRLQDTLRKSLTLPSDRGSLHATTRRKKETALSVLPLRGHGVSGEAEGGRGNLSTSAPADARSGEAVDASRRSIRLRDRKQVRRVHHEEVSTSGGEGSLPVSSGSDQEYYPYQHRPAQTRRTRARRKLTPAFTSFCPIKKKLEEVLRKKEEKEEMVLMKKEEEEEGVLRKKEEGEGVEKEEKCPKEKLGSEEKNNFKWEEEQVEKKKHEEEEKKMLIHNSKEECPEERRRLFNGFTSEMDEKHLWQDTRQYRHNNLPHESHKRLPDQHNEPHDSPQPHQHHEEHPPHQTRQRRRNRRDAVRPYQTREMKGKLDNPDPLQTRDERNQWDISNPHQAKDTRNYQGTPSPLQTRYCSRNTWDIPSLQQSKTMSCRWNRATPHKTRKTGYNWSSPKDWKNEWDTTSPYQTREGWITWDTASPHQTKEMRYRWDIPSSHHTTDRRINNGDIPRPYQDKEMRKKWDTASPRQTGKKSNKMNTLLPHRTTNTTKKSTQYHTKERRNAGIQFSPYKRGITTIRSKSSPHRRQCANRLLEVRERYWDPDRLSSLPNMLRLLLGLVYLVVLLTKEEVLLMDLLRWCRNGQIPFLSAHVSVNCVLRRYAPRCAVYRRVPAVPSSRTVRRVTRQLALLLSLQTVPLPSPAAVLRRLAAVLRLPEEITTLAREVVAVRNHHHHDHHHHDHHHQSNHQREDWLELVVGEVPGVECQGAAALLVALKLSCGLNDTTEHQLSAVATRVNEVLGAFGDADGTSYQHLHPPPPPPRPLFSFDEWMSYISRVVWLSKRVDPLCELSAPLASLPRPAHTRLMAGLRRLLTFCTSDPPVCVSELGSCPTLRRQLESRGLSLEKLCEGCAARVSGKPRDPLLGTLEEYVECHQTTASPDLLLKAQHLMQTTFAACQLLWTQRLPHIQKHLMKQGSHLILKPVKFPHSLHSHTHHHPHSHHPHTNPPHDFYRPSEGDRGSHGGARSKTHIRTTNTVLSSDSQEEIKSWREDIVRKGSNTRSWSRAEEENRHETCIHGAVGMFSSESEEDMKEWWKDGASLHEERIGRSIDRSFLKSKEEIRYRVEAELRKEGIYRHQQQNKDEFSLKLRDKLNSWKNRSKYTWDSKYGDRCFGSGSSSSEDSPPPPPACTWQREYSSREDICSDCQFHHHLRPVGYGWDTFGPSSEWGSQRLWPTDTDGSSLEDDGDACGCDYFMGFGDKGKEDAGLNGCKDTTVSGDGVCDFRVSGDEGKVKDGRMHVWKGPIMSGNEGKMKDEGRCNRKNITAFDGERKGNPKLVAVEECEKVKEQEECRREEVKTYEGSSKDSEKDGVFSEDRRKTDRGFSEDRRNSDGNKRKINVQEEVENKGERDAEEKEKEEKENEEEEGQQEGGDEKVVKERNEEIEGEEEEKREEERDYEGKENKEKQDEDQEGVEDDLNQEEERAVRTSQDASFSDSSSCSSVLAHGSLDRLLPSDTDANVASSGTLFVPVPTYRVWHRAHSARARWRQVWSGLPRSYRRVVSVMSILCGLTRKELVEEVERALECYLYCSPSSSSLSTFSASSSYFHLSPTSFPSALSSSGE